MEEDVLVKCRVNVYRCGWKGQLCQRYDKRNSYRNYFIGHGLVRWVSDGWQFGSGGKATARDLSTLRDVWVMLVDLQVEIRKQPRICWQRRAGELL